MEDQLRKHIWSFAGSSSETGTLSYFNCPCINVTQARSSASSPPAFVGNDYFCDTGSENGVTHGFFYDADPLWDGAGCGPLNTCCTFNNPPWFYKELLEPTTDDIEMRVCQSEGSSNEDIAIEMIYIYVK